MSASPPWNKLKTKNIHLSMTRVGLCKHPTTPVTPHCLSSNLLHHGGIDLDLRNKKQMCSSCQKHLNHFCFRVFLIWKFANLKRLTTNLQNICNILLKSSSSVQGSWFKGEGISWSGSQVPEMKLDEKFYCRSAKIAEEHVSQTSVGCFMSFIAEK